MMMMSLTSTLRKSLLGAFLLAILLSSVPNMALAACHKNGNCESQKPCPTSTRHITGKTVGAGLLSFLIWPGIGQAVNNQPGSKVGTHAVLGLLGVTRFWSGYDALVDRQGGYWHGRI